jgi:PPOX class probable F420-dependent enzyme
MTTNLARERFGLAQVARLATVGPSGAPHLVPVTFALLDADTLVSAVDHKPKRTPELRRLANIEANPAVSLLVDHYEDDWARLWWARADGRARVIRPHGDRDGDQALRAAAVDALVRRYAHYRAAAPDGAVIVVAVQRWSAWRAS